MKKYLTREIGWFERLMFRHKRTKIDNTEFIRRSGFNWGTMNIIAILVCICIVAVIFIAR